jgi:GH24 family phage-related lysozyme (muramidase)
MHCRAVVVGVTVGLCLSMASWGSSFCKNTTSDRENARGTVEILALQYQVKGRAYTAYRVTENDIQKAGLPAAACTCGEEACRKSTMWRCLAGNGDTCRWYPTTEGC